MLRGAGLEGVEQLGRDLLGALAQPLDGAHGEDPGDELAVARVVGRLGHQQRRRLDRVEGGRRGPPGDPAERPLVGGEARAEVVAGEQLAYGGVAGGDVPDPRAVERAPRPDLLDQLEDLVGAQRPDLDQPRLQVAAVGGPPQQQRRQAVGDAPSAPSTSCARPHAHEGSRGLPRLRGMWLAVDLLLVGVFAVIGRLSHYGTLTAGGWWTTAWPFLAGHAGRVGPCWRRDAADPAAIISGVVVWLGALVGGMAAAPGQRPGHRHRVRGGRDPRPRRAAGAALESVHVSDADARPRGAAVPFGILLAAVVLVSVNLRPGASSPGPVLEEVRQGLGMSAGVAGAMTGLPGLCFGAGRRARGRLRPQGRDDRGHRDRAHRRRGRAAAPGHHRQRAAVPRSSPSSRWPAWPSATCSSPPGSRRTATPSC